MQRISVIDSHTGGEPTRTVTGGGPDLGTGSLAERCERFRVEHDHFRSAVINEPRGSDVIVGALLCEPNDDSCVAGVIFFNNVGTLNMCGHGTIGVAVTLAHQNRIKPGSHRLETPVGVVGFDLHEDGRHVTIKNVPSFRLASAVTVDVPGHGKVTGDVAWGGNWFFLVGDHGQQLDLTAVDHLTRFCIALRDALSVAGITGHDGALIDHIELFGDSDVADSQNFVLCPGSAYDRSPCGTGTSAKVACLAADEKLQPGAVWRQQSIIGSEFQATYTRNVNNTITPSITGSAWVTAETELLLDPTDPFQFGITK